MVKTDSTEKDLLEKNFISLKEIISNNWDIILLLLFANIGAVLLMVYGSYLAYYTDEIFAGRLGIVVGIILGASCICFEVRSKLK